MDNPDLSKDLRVRNVSLHSRGKTENGTLYLTRHHLIFSYLPDAGTGKSAANKSAELRSRAVATAQASARSSLTVSREGSSSISDVSQVRSDSLDAPAQDGSRKSSDHHESKQPVATLRARPKEIWLPYPMINHCMLRPSHAQPPRNLDHETHQESTDEDGEDAAFPPVYGTSAYARPSTDSHLAPYSSPQRSLSPSGQSPGTGTASESGRPPAIRIRRRDFQMMAFHFHSASKDKSPDDSAREVFYRIRHWCCASTVRDLHAFHFKPPPEELATSTLVYDARREFARMGISAKAAEGPGSAWRISDINHDYAYAATYPSVICVPRSVSDNMLKYGGVFRSKSRIPALTYLHSNGGSITRSSQPMVGVQSKRNPQDERLVSAIFSSHTPSTPSPSDSPDLVASTFCDSSKGNSLDSDANGDVPVLSVSQSETALDIQNAEPSVVTRKKIYGSTRRNLIVDARPRINALANRATGGGIEDVANYGGGTTGGAVERIFLNIANIHVMRQSLDKVIESFANSDYLDLKPNQELLRKSGWLAHIAGLLDGSEMVARVVGLGGSHVLVHCSDGWDRTSQVAALAEIMLDPFYRTLQGFITLVQKDFFSFGHKFNHRHGIQGSEKWFEIENEKVLPSRTKEATGSDSPGFLGSKALSGAKNWFDKNRGSIFRQSHDSSGTDGAGSRPPSPPANALLHAPPTASSKEDKEHKVDTKEIAPIFHQFLDAVYQIQRQNPNAFEFNERFLRRLYYQAYSGQYGEFLFNTEKERAENMDKTHSVWPHFLSRRAEFVNPDYASKTNDPLLFPYRQSPDQLPEVQWWSGLFGRKDEDMISSRLLAPPDVPTVSVIQAQPSTVSLDQGVSTKSEAMDSTGIKESKSIPSFGAVTESITSKFASFQVGMSDQHNVKDEHPEAKLTPARPALEQRETDTDVLAKYVATNDEAAAEQVAEPVETNTHGDPLGVMTGSAVPEAVSSGRMDFAAFARGSAYSEHR
ncbi:unnamed protein product [Zymoseptoria tritici ST99CH_3D1]|uniref:Myotubularin phosphatase domain-containing protein n=2 Tax=Zymoseptoria tritici TaxID=1047171 RepID=A0A1X7RF80_ZYMT9|nr:unnamed protein product [Zymoseptoria tritici ST99CH_3D7]SMR42417.1 unnamed protein product [Zymoseptoria tritici ST99CH_1E4]SMR44595.1 unnamed protein product [Zymoseptoria tritici ST99CH_3D1]